MEYGPFSVYQIPSFNPLVLASDYFICEGEETQLVLQEEDTYLDYAWEVFNANGEILSDDLTEIISGSPSQSSNKLCSTIVKPLDIDILLQPILIDSCSFLALGELFLKWFWSI